MKKRVFSLLIILVMVLSLLPASVFADEPVTVTINIAPSTVNVNFFADASAEAAVDSAAIEDKGVVKVGSYNYHQYVLTVAPGTYSYRGTDGDYVLGGEQFAVTKADTINLLRANVYYNSTVLNTVGDYIFTLENDVTKKNVELGTPYLSSNKLYTPTLLIAGDKHNGVVTSLATKWDDSYFIKSNGSFSTTPSKTTGTASTVTLSVIDSYKIIKLTAPTAATTTFYKQDANFVVEPVTPDDSVKDEENGTTTYIFKDTVAHSNYQFRSMMSGEMTQAGYLADGNNIAVSFDDGDPYSTVSAMEYDDNSVLLNIKTGNKLIGQNKLNLNVGESFKLRAFRGAWEIVDTTSANHMIEPDFHYAILSGYDVVSITPTTECSNSKFPNAKNGNATDNWMNVKALKKGKAVVAVWYDAINVFNANPPAANGWAVFGAADPARYGVFVVSVGDDTGITWNPASHDGDWDAEFDVVYYNGDEGYFVFAPNEDVTNVTVQNVYGTTLSSAKCVSASADGSFSVPVTNGANIIAVTTEDGTDYQIVRAKKINYTITNNTTGEFEVNGAPLINTEDEVTISFDKLDMPVPKMSGIYNPGYLGTAKAAYELNDSMLLTSKGTQYDFSTNNSITFKAHVAGENNLKGYISLSSMGDPFGNHRGIDDDGKPVNMNAGEVFGDFGVLPDIKFTVTDNGQKISYKDATNITSLTVKGANSTGYLTGFTNWTTVGDGNSNWTAATSAMTEYTLTANIKTKDYYNKLQLRYWYDGEEVHTTDLVAGATNTINGFTLVAEKILNLQVVITPMDPNFGDSKTYTYIVYPGNANLKYVHPVIKSMTATSAAANLAFTSSWNTADTEYELKVGEADEICLKGEQLIKIYNPAITADKSDKVVLTTLNDGVQVGDAVTILETGVPTNPNRYWTTNVAISGVDELQIKVTSYVTESAFRLYSIRLNRETPDERDAVNTAKKRIEDVDSWSLSMTEANNSNAIKSWIENKLSGLALGDAAAAVSVTCCTPAVSGDSSNYEGSNGYYEAEIGISKGDASDIVKVSGTIEATVYNPPVAPLENTVTFRLIGSKRATQDVDLSSSSYLPEYETWIPTTTITISDGYTVADVFNRAMAEYGLRSDDTSDNYISTIYAPEVLGGYELSEFTNGLYSGWMYTIKGKHPGSGISDKIVSSGDRIIWHYVNDYRYEVSDWFEGSLGDGKYYNKWLKAADKNPSAAYDPEYRPAETKAEDKQEPDKTSEIEIAPVTPNDGKAEIIVESKDIKKTVEAAVKAEEFGKAEDKVDTIAIKTDIQGDAKQVKVSLPAESLKMIADKTNAGVDVQTPNGNVLMPSDALKEITSQAGKENIEVKVENKAPEDVKENVVSKLAEVLKDAPAKADGTKFDEKLLDKATVVDIKISAGDKNITGFNGNSITVSVPVDAKKFKEGKFYRTFIQSSDGSLEAKAAHITGGNAEVETSHLSTFVITEEEVSPFIDIDIVNDWFAESATKAFEKKIINGVGGNVFDSKSTFTRAMIVQVLYNLEGKPATEYEMTFNDVAEDAWYADAVRWAQSTGIVGGYPDGRFDPNGAVTREQTALILMNYAKYKKLDVTKRNELNEYPDMSKISSWALDAVKWANALKLIIGSDNKLNPTGDATRAEAVTILVRFIENVK